MFSLGDQHSLHTVFIKYSLQVDTTSSRSYPGQQAANLGILFAARSANLDGPRYIGDLFWSANMMPRRVHFFHLHCYVNPSRRFSSNGRRCQWPALLCDPQPGSLKPGNSWSQQSVHHVIHGRQDEQLDSCWDPGDAASPRSLLLSVLSACCCSGTLLTVATFK